MIAGLAETDERTFTDAPTGNTTAGFNISSVSGEPIPSPVEADDKTRDPNGISGTCALAVRDIAVIAAAKTKA